MNISHHARIFVLFLVLAGCASEAGDGSASLGEGAIEEEVESLEQALEHRCLNIGVTSTRGNRRYITGYGNVACPGSGGYIDIRRSRWYGWDILVTKKLVGGQGDVHIEYDCYGTGQHDFWTRVYGTTIGGKYVYKDSNVITVDCPG